MSPLSEMHFKLPLFCDYEDEYNKRWALVREYLDILSKPHTDCDKIHHNQISCRYSSMDIFTIVYQMCLIKFGKQLYNDIMDYCRSHIFQWDNLTLDEASHLNLDHSLHYGHCLAHVRATKFLSEFLKVLKRFVHLVSVGFDSIVMYHLDRVYVAPTFHTTMKDLMVQAFCAEVAYNHMEELVKYTKQHPHAMGREAMMEMDELLNKLDPAKMKIDVHLAEYDPKQLCRLKLYSQQFTQFQNVIDGISWDSLT